MTTAATRPIDHRRKLLVLGAALVVVLAILLQRKLMPTARQWSELRTAVPTTATRDELVMELKRLSDAQGRVDRLLRPDGAPQERWAPLLSRTGELTKARRAVLVEVMAEHRELVQGRAVHSLPMVLSGRADDLLTCADVLERELPGIRLVSLDLHATPRPPDRTRALHATLIFRTIRP